MSALDYAIVLGVIFSTALAEVWLSAKWRAYQCRKHGPRWDDSAGVWVCVRCRHEAGE